MKRKLFLPMLAILFAVASAFASPLFIQKGWIDTNGPTSGGGVELDIVSPSGDTPVCSTSATQHQCMVSFDGDLVPAYNSKTAAEGSQSAKPVEVQLIVLIGIGVTQFLSFLLQ